MIETKDDIIAIYIKIKEHLGHQPTSTEFYIEAEMNQNKLEGFFGSNAFTKLVVECGDIPNRFGREKSDFESIVVKYGSLYRELKEHPKEADWKQRKYVPSVSGITQSFKIKWTNMPQIFLDFAYGKTEWQDVANLIPSDSSNSKIDLNNYSQTIPFQIQNFLPPVVNDLIELSYNDSLALEFEKKVNTSFEMLGFEVKGLGQGTGRKPDGIALSKTNPRFAILIDSKSRSEGYRFGTDDRAFVEYIKTYSNRLKNDGFDKLYFIVISSKFISIPESSTKRLALETHVPITFLSSRLLLKILANRIEKPRIFDLDKFRTLLIDSGEILESKIDRFFQDLNKSQSI